MVVIICRYSGWITNIEGITSFVGGSSAMFYTSKNISLIQFNEIINVAWGFDVTFNDLELDWILDNSVFPINN